VQTRRWSVVKEILFRPGVFVVGIIYFFLELASNVIAWTQSPEDQAKYQFIKLISWRTWLVATPLLTILLIGLIVRAAIQAIEKREKQLDALQTHKFSPDQSRQLIRLMSEGDRILYNARARQGDVHDDIDTWETNAGGFLKDNLGLENEGAFVHALVEPAEISGAGTAHRMLIGRIQAKLSVLHKINEEQRDKS
jgi:hypothetical protein